MFNFFESYKVFLEILDIFFGVYVYFIVSMYVLYTLISDFG